MITFRDFNEGKLDHRDMNVYEQVYLRGIVTQQNGYAFVLQVKSMRKVKVLSSIYILLKIFVKCLKSDIKIRFFYLKTVRGWYSSVKSLSMFTIFRKGLIYSDNQKTVE